MRVWTLWQVVLPLYILALALIVLWSATHRRPELRVIFLDVGQGDSCVVEVTVSGTVEVRASTPKLADFAQDFPGLCHNRMHSDLSISVA